MYIYVIPHIHTCIARQHKVSNECWTRVLHRLKENWLIPRASAHEKCYGRARNRDARECVREKESA